ncbi:MAG: glycosyl hydrolase family 59 [Oscillospiraceae bacterium]|nr:glycosyl hydrolase family 59 [Oscillospiraceae bacterium]
MERVIRIGASMLNKIPNQTFDGYGMVSANNSSRLLIDYKQENPTAYMAILERIFGEKGIGVSHLKIEMGSDVNSSSGTEPAVKRYADERADVRRGAGFQLAADAKRLNPNLNLDMLWWSEPAWVTHSSDVYAARYRWYRGTLIAAYEAYGIKFDYVSGDKNERPFDKEWIKYLSRRLKEEQDCPYDFSRIKISAADEICTWFLANLMLEDKELLKAVDAVGSHYTSTSTENAVRLSDEYGKFLWMSEGSPPMTYSRGAYRFDGTGSGLAGINGILDAANRMIAMYACGRMTMCQLQPIVSAYYDGVTYSHKQLISACCPWSGYYRLESGYAMMMHFSQFIKKGWVFVNDGCFSDGKPGGDGHAIVDATYSYLTAVDSSTGDYSTVITNTTDMPITYRFIADPPKSVSVWETKGPNKGCSDYSENYFRKIQTIAPENTPEGHSFRVTVNPYSIVTVSTVEPICGAFADNIGKNTVLALPYSDDFCYSEYSPDYLSSRGGAPRYTTDEGGAFEVNEIDGRNVLMQIITPDIKAVEWGYTPNPVTTLGDDRWYNYSVSIKASFADKGEPNECYVGVGMRYILADIAESGWQLRLYKSGVWQLRKNSRILIEGKSDNPVRTAVLKIESMYNSVRAYLNGTLLCDYSAENEGVPCAGRAALYSSYDNNYFEQLLIEPLENTYIERFDNTDLCFSYKGNWKHELMTSFRNYNRTLSTGYAGDKLYFTFEGTGFSLVGENHFDDENPVISVNIDGKSTFEGKVPMCENRQASYCCFGLENSKHIAEVTVISGKYSIDSGEISHE